MIAEDFRRHPTSGAPMIRTPDGKIAQYGRPSGATKDLDDQTALSRWKERMTAIGIAASEEAQACITAALEYPEGSDGQKALLDEAIELALAAAKANLASLRGTFAHSLIEERVPGEEDVKELIAGGELLGVTLEAQRMVLEAWDGLVEGVDFDVLVQEARVVNHRYRKAGTVDCYIRLRRDVRFTFPGTGEIVILPAGLVLACDHKTSKLWQGKNGIIRYWLGYSAQLAIYATADGFYDVENEETVPFPEEWGGVSHEWGLISHIPVKDFIENGGGVAQVFLVDLKRGIADMELVEEVKAARKAFRFGVTESDMLVRVGYDRPQVQATTTTITAEQDSYYE